MDGAGCLFVGILFSGIYVSKMQEICWLLVAFAYINVKSECVLVDFQIKVQ